MGLIFSRENARVDELDNQSSNAYKYPPKTGNYFASHFIMGGERFETNLPEAYLFGDNSELNFLGGKPTPFPYPAPEPNVPTRTLPALLNIRKESLRFVRVHDHPESTSYSITFIFDCEVSCSIIIKYFCREEISINGVNYTPQDASMNSEKFLYKRGINQTFNQTSHVFDPSRFPEDMLKYKFEEEIIPVLIMCVAEEGEEPRQAHMLISWVEKINANAFNLKPLKQKLFIDGLCYIFQEIYGIENKNVYSQNKEIADDLDVDSGSECVICMSLPRDTLILPCRHLCLCRSCADSLRYSASNCVICRAPFRALLKISAVRKSNAPSLPQISHNAENQASQDIPPGYEPVSLIEALNGPVQHSAPIPSFAFSRALDYMIGPESVPVNNPPFSNSPGVHQKHRHLDRQHSSSASLRSGEFTTTDKDDSAISKRQGSLDGFTVPEVVIPLKSSDKIGHKTESLSLTRSEGRKHRKGFRTSSAPEKMRLLTNSMEIVNEVGNSKRKLGKKKDSESAETRSLLESNTNVEETSIGISSPKNNRPCSRSSPISLSTPHSLHLCDKSSKDTSPGGEDSDYFTPEDPSTTILVDQGTDTSLDTPQGIESGSINDTMEKGKSEGTHDGKHKLVRERYTCLDEVERDSCNLHDRKKRNSDPLNKFESTPDSLMCPDSCSPTIKLENTHSLPGTPASKASNQSSGDSFSSTSSSRLLFRPQSYDTLQE